MYKTDPNHHIHFVCVDREYYKMALFGSSKRQPSRSSLDSLFENRTKLYISVGGDSISE